MIRRCGSALAAVGLSLQALDSTQLLALGNITVGGTHDSSSRSQSRSVIKRGLMLSGSPLNPSVDLKRQQQGQQEQQDQRWVGSSIGSSSGSTQIESLAGQLLVIGSQLSAAQDKELLVKGQGVAVANALDQHSSNSQQSSKRSNLHLSVTAPSQGIGAKTTEGNDGQHTELVRSSLSGGRVELHASGTAASSTAAGDESTAPHSLVLQGTDIQARELALIAPQSTVALNLATTSSSQSSNRSQSDLMYQKARGQGANEVQEHFNSLSHDSLTLNAQDVQIQLPQAQQSHGKQPSAEGGTAQTQASESIGLNSPAESLQTLQTLARQPQTAWIGQVLQQQQAAMEQDPQRSLHSQRVLLSSQSWDYKQQGLTEAGAAVVTLVVAYFTAGAASGAGTSAATSAGMTTTAGAAGASTVAATGAGVAGSGLAAGTVLTTGGAALSAAIGAGLSTLAAQASVSFINNGGDIGQTLKDLGQKDSLKSLITGMVSAGALNSLGSQFQIGDKTLNQISVKDGFAANLGKAVLNNVASATLNSTLTGASLEDSLKTALVSAAISAGAGQAANAIGGLTVDGINPTLNTAGAALAHALAGCVAGAAGQGGSAGCSAGAIGAVVGELSAQWFDPGAQRSEAEVLEFARLMGGVAGALTGDGSAASVNTAAMTALNAVQNNYLETRDLKHAIQQLDSCSVGCDSLRRLLTANEPGGVQKPVGGLQDLCKANPQACAARVQDMAQALQELQTPEVRATLGTATAERLIQRQVNDLNQALGSLQWGVEHAESSTAIVKGALMVGATAAGAGVLVNVGRTVVAACASGVLSPACTGLMTELGIGVAEAASGVPTLGVSAPVAAAATARLVNAAKTADPALVAREVQAVLAQAKAAQTPPVSRVEELFGQTFEVIPLSHTKNFATGSYRQDGELGEQLALQLLNEKTNLNFKPLQNASNWGCDGCAVAINGDTITVVVMDAKSSQNGVDAAASAAGDPRTRLRGWLDTASIADSDKVLSDAIREALRDGAKVQGVTVKVGLPAPGTTGTAEFKVEPWPNK